MTQLYGYLYQRALFSAFKAHNLRTWGDVRATTALAAPLPFNLYSDAYSFDQYLRQLVNASFTGCSGRRKCGRLIAWTSF
jgi:alpha-D-xyloside xylohydrolase